MGMTPFRRLAYALLSLIPFYLFRVRVPILGDGPSYIQRLTVYPTGGNMGWHEWGTVGLVRFIYWAIGGHNEDDAFMAYQVMSWACGVAYVWLCVGIAEDMEVGKTGQRSAYFLTLACLLTPGTLANFCGYPENYGPLTVGVTAFLWTGMRYLRGKGSLYAPALVFGATVAMHFTAIVLAPAMAWLAWKE